MIENNDGVPFYSEFYRYEMKYAHIEIEGFKIWHLFRDVYFRAISKGKGLYLGEHPDLNILNKKFTSKIKIGVEFLFNAVIMSPKKKFKKDKEYLIVCAPRKVLYKEEYVNTLLRYYFMTLSGNYNFLERPRGFHHFSGKPIENSAFSDGIEVKRLINQIVKRYHFNSETTSILSCIADDLCEKFDISLDKNKLLRDIQYQWNGFRTYYEEYGKLLDLFKPKIIIEDCHYDKTIMAITKCAKERGIITAEPQHGIIGRHHYAYNYSEMDEYTPDYFLAYGSAWLRNISMPSKVVFVGNPHLEECVELFSSRDERRGILFLSQGGVSSLLSEVAIELHKRLQEKSSSSYVIFRLHPSEFQTWKMLNPILLESGVEVIDSPDKTLYECYNESFVQIGISSTALYEGLAFGLKTLVLHDSGYEAVHDLIETGSAKLIDSVDDIEIEINAGNSSQMFKPEDYWCADSRTTLKEKLLKIATD